MFGNDKALGDNIICYLIGDILNLKLLSISRGLIYLNLVAGHGIAPCPSGYEPDVLLLHSPTIFLNLEQSFSNVSANSD